MWFDSHCHIHDDPEPLALVARAREAGIEGLICVGTDAAASRRALSVASAAEGVWATAGLHPHDARQGVDGIVSLLDELVAQPQRGRLVAIGECGLDYHYDRSPRPVQREVFAAQINLAHAYGLPLVIHTREAWDDTLAVLGSEGAPDRTVFHCFTGGPTEARRCLEVDAYLSFSGIVTFAGATEVREAAAICPAERLLVETDSPYLAPVPHRGKPNEPVLLPAVGAGIAAVRGIAVEKVAESSRTATCAAFGLELEGSAV